MAVPASVNTKAPSGRFLLNKSLSDDPDEVLHFQGVARWKRRLISLFSLTLRVKHTTDDAGVEYFDMDQIVSGIPGMKDKAILDGREHDQNHLIFGLLTTKSLRMSAEDIEDAYLKKDWAQNCVVRTECWSTPGKNDRTWSIVQIWGFAMVNGERRCVTQIAFTSPLKEDGPIHARFVYDYLGSA